MPDFAYVERDCETMWWLVAHPIQTITEFAVANIPGKASGPLRELLHQRVEAFTATANGGKIGRLEWSNVLRLASTFSEDETVFLLAPKGLQTQEISQAIPVGSTSRFDLFKLEHPPHIQRP